MKKALATALAAAVTALLSAGPGTPATAASQYCRQTSPNSSMLFYNGRTGAAATGTLSAGHWRQKATSTLPENYTRAAVSRDTLLLYNPHTGDGETGTFTAGTYTRAKVFAGSFKGWFDVVASGDSVLFYDESSGRGVTGSLKNGLYRQARTYDDLGKGWVITAGSCDTMVFAKGIGETDEDHRSALAYGTLRNGVYTQVGAREADGFLGDMTATKDSVLAFSATDAEFFYKVGTAVDGKVGAFRDSGTSVVWDTVDRTSDSLLFYRSDGAAATSTLSGGHYAFVGPLPGVSSDWSVIEGGV
ncbi:hypothetical protein [Streptomyces sp. NPDC089799]|uniref:hypothetical protein n=1 Tax=Streptomyces sp. NPDC089799 TaxID=3155066 RepID=UPI0034249ADF